MRKYRWAKISGDSGVYLQMQGPDARGTLWFPVAKVFKAKRGDRWIVELWPTPYTYERHAVHNLREGLRLCKMLALLEHRNV